ncbi:Na(+)-translocating NADH-quinone reductase subunit F [Winogradskyella sp. 3972H.M.0a.05]|uniref:Na(+)-translocating NADH-quinone reductase subunit F n=1 Tax=Winogradskyella sp. 3972H.M.0a.05 TaxID=2950277 RepID=UPI00339147B6
MKTTARFDNAIQKLYTAFHNNHLNPECSKQCAVGNILDNTDSWKNLSDKHGSLQLNYVGLVNQKFDKRFNGYTPMELLQIEAEFLKGCGYSLPLHHKGIRPEYPESKDVLFNGLKAVIEFLCQLDGIRNIMDYSSLFTKQRTVNLVEL